MNRSRMNRADEKNKPYKNKYMSNYTMNNNNNTNNSGLFFRPNGTLTGATFWILGVGVPLIILSGRWFAGAVCILLGFGLATCHAMSEMTQHDQLELRFQAMPAMLVVEEMENAVAVAKHAAAVAADKPEDSTRHCEMTLLLALEAMAQKMNTKKRGMYDVDELEIACQQAAFVALESSSNISSRDCNNDTIVAAAISLLALVAKNSAVRERHRLPQTLSHTFCGVRLPLSAVRSSLQRIQEHEHDVQISPDDEALVAEIQRKACLWIGALADGDMQLASFLVDEGGLEAILKALDWFRYHHEVNSWGLWAIFNLCLEHEGNQMELVRLGGLAVLCKSILLNCEESLEVCRHGLAILFDLLRQRPANDVKSAAAATCKKLEIRKLAVGAGLHDAVRESMAAYPGSMEIMGMGTEMLLSTGYDGDIPQYQPSE